MWSVRLHLLLERFEFGTYLARYHRLRITENVREPA